MSGAADKVGTNTAEETKEDGFDAVRIPVIPHKLFKNVIAASDKGTTVMHVRFEDNGSKLEISCRQMMTSVSYSVSAETYRDLCAKARAVWRDGQWDAVMSAAIDAAQAFCQADRDQYGYVTNMHAEFLLDMAKYVLRDLRACSAAKRQPLDGVLFAGYFIYRNVAADS